MTMVMRFFASTAVGVLLCVPLIVAAETVAEQKARLQAQLGEIEKQIEVQRAILSEKQKERTSLERDVAIITAQIQTAQLSLKQRELALTQIGRDIREKEIAIGGVDEKVVREQASLAQILRNTHMVDETTLVELVLSGGSITDVFDDVDVYRTLQGSLQDSFAEMVALRQDLSDRKRALQEKQNEEEELKQIQVLQKQQLQSKENEKQQILDQTKGQEKAYQNILNNKQQEAAKIRAALFAFRDSAAIPFGDALRYAEEASKKTGVRPAVILAVLKQETNLGENVGQCLLTNSPKIGDGIGKNTGRYFSQVMKGSRDVEPFMQITAELGIDPFSQVVSCPPGYGYGGAMGPAQFIPSTWILYKDRIAKATGTNPPNPWEARTAIFATAILMMDNGADGATWSSERLAALRYFAGWGNANKPAYAFYGDSVMEIADDLQKQIDILSGS